jgi:hypothetical protein
MRKVVALVGALLVACSTSASPSPAPTSAPTQTAPGTAAPTTAAPRTSPPVATQNPGRADVVLRWAPGTNISDIDDVYDMISHLKNTPGILDGFGDESQITVVYNPQLVTPEQIRRLLADMGFPTQPLS